MVRIPRNGVEQTKPSFFKIILPGYSSEHVRLPPRFVQNHIVNELSKRAKLNLMRSSEYSWKVKVKRSGEDVYLEDGWLEFHRDACLGDKEFLVFIYTGKMHFSVQVFNKNGCERMDFSDIKTHQNTTSSGSTRRPRERPRKSSKGNSADKLKEVKEEQVDFIDNSERSTSKSTEMPHGSPTKPTSECSKRSALRQIESTSESCKRPRGRPRKYPETCKDSVPDIIDLQRILKSFSNEHLSPGQYELSLKNSKGKWDVKILKSRGSLYLSAGWRAFAEASEIKLRDACTLELVSEKRMVVRICGK